MSDDHGGRRLAAASEENGVGLRFFDDTLKVAKRTVVDAVDLGPPRPASLDRPPRE